MVFGAQPPPECLLPQNHGKEKELFPKKHSDIRYPHQRASGTHPLHSRRYPHTVLRAHKIATLPTHIYARYTYNSTQTHGSASLSQIDVATQSTVTNIRVGTVAVFPGAWRTPSQTTVPTEQRASLMNYAHARACLYSIKGRKHDTYHCTLRFAETWRAGTFPPETCIRQAPGSGRPQTGKKTVSFLPPMFT